MAFEIVPSFAGRRRRACLSCGADTPNAARRYCSRECRQQMLWVLSLSRGLLKVFNARYAAFSFSSNHVILDVLPVWSREISRFVHKRGNGRKPADDLKILILQSGEEWYHFINTRTSRSYASLLLLKKNNQKGIAPGAITPDKRIRPRLSKQEREALGLLELKIDQLLSAGNVSKIRSAYKKLAKVYHPDIGGDEEKFKRLNEAHHQMLAWAESPHYTSKKALSDCWSYDGVTSTWTPPL